MNPDDIAKRITDDPGVPATHGPDDAEKAEELGFEMF
jgi:hypothetical protein